MASLLELLVSRRMISPEQAKEAAASAEETGAFIGKILVFQGSVEEQLLARFLAAECTEKAEPGTLRPDEHLVRLLPERLMRNYRMVPLARSPSGVLRLAVAEPLSIGGIDQVKRRLGMPVRLVLVDAQTIDALLDQAALPVASPVSVGEPAPQPAVPAPTQPAPAPPPRPAAPAQKAMAAPSARHAATPPEKPMTAPPAKAAAPSSVPGAVSTAMLAPRATGPRVQIPDDWHPGPVSSAIPSVLEAPCQALKDMLARERKAFVALVGPDSARDLVLRKVCGDTWPWDQILYLDLVAHLCPEEPPDGPFSATVIDGVDEVIADEDEDEERRVLRVVSSAYASHAPLIIGVRKPPKESEHLSGRMRLTLGLAKVIAIDAQEASEPAPSTVDPRAVFRALADETAAWSDVAFPGASLRPLLEATARAYDRGNRADAVTKAATSVASRLAHLSAELNR